MFRSFFSGDWIRLLLLAALGLGMNVMAMAAPEMPTKDLQGAQDHPMISRFTGSVIAGYEQVDYEQVLMPLGPYDRNEPEKFSKVEQPQGKLTRLFYMTPAGKSSLEILRNYQQGLTAAGFKVLFECSAGKDAGSCGGHHFSEMVANEALNYKIHGGGHYIDAFAGGSDDVRALTARLERSQGNVDVSVLVVKDGEKPIGVLLQIVESKPMATGQVTVDAKAMSKGLADTGHIALYGIHFATDSATLAADSKETLAQMAELLKSKPSLKVYIVGHTDNTGSLAHNLTLSQQRAEAVVAALHKDYGIDSGRMAAKGMASYGPVASNHSQAGQALNRRVELVEQ